MKKMVIAALVVFTLVIFGVVILWWSARGMVSRTTDLIDEAEAFGKNSTDAQCFEEALSRYRACSVALCEIMQTPFAATCFGVSRRTPEFCGEVPSPGAGDGGESWRHQGCLRLGGDSKPCQSLLSAAQNHCWDI